MWFFVDESWSADHCTSRFGVLLGVLVKDEHLEKLDRFLFSIRKKYYGSDNAKDKSIELKGSKLLSKHILKMHQPGNALPKNLCIVREMLDFPIKNQSIYLKIFASTVCSLTDKHPSLLSPNPRLLSEPFKRLIENVSNAAKEDVPGRKVTLVFDQRGDAQKDLAIAIYNYVAGMRLPNIEIFPYFAVSNVSPGVQFADVMAYLLSKRVESDQSYKRLIMSLYNDMKKLCWESKATPRKYGLVKFNERIENGMARYTVRR